MASSAYWLFLPLAYGFIARVLSGPRLSPLARLATAVVAPRLGAPKPVPGPPKRFAQAIGRDEPEVIEGASHFLQEDAGERIGARIADWLGRP